MRFLVMLLLGCTLLGCGPSYADLVEDHREETGAVYEDCGKIKWSAFCKGITPGETCMLDAFAACRPAETEVTVAGDGGDIYLHWFIDVRGGGACIVTEIADYSEDEYKGDYADLQVLECTTLARHDECPRVIPDDCSLIEEH